MQPPYEKQIMTSNEKGILYNSIDNERSWNLQNELSKIKRCCVDGEIGTDPSGKLC